MSDFLPLQDGAVYADGEGHHFTIGGTCREYPDWCWTFNGEWFERSTGRVITYRPNTGKHEVVTVPTWRHLARRVGA